MTESTLPRDRTEGRPPAARVRQRSVASSSRLQLGWPAAVALALLLLSTALVLWARTRPGFDPYGWLVWGHQTLLGTLDTNAAPSWKPLPYLFTVPYALAGHQQLRLWMITSVAVSLSGAVFAARIAYRLTGTGDGRGRYPAVVAAAFAAFALPGIRDYPHYVLSAQSDPMIVALCLAAIDCHLARRYRGALLLGGLAALGRPEVWPFLALYAAWGWRRLPSLRWLLAGIALVIALLWFGIPALTSRSPFVAGSNALGSGRAPHGNKALVTVDRFLDLQETSLELLALLSVAWAAVRRDRVTLALAGAAVAWVIVEIAFALHGWPGLGRYMFEAMGVFAVVAAVGLGRLLAEPGRVSRAAAIVAAVAAAALCATMVPATVSRTKTERQDLRLERARTTRINRLATTISRLGGAAALRTCGEPLTWLEYQTVLAWQLGLNVSSIGFKFPPAIARRDPIVLFVPRAHGWRVRALHQRSAFCRAL